MKLDKYEKVYFIGMGGIGVSAVAGMMISLGKEVFGSDACKSDITEDLEKLSLASGRKVKIFYNHDKINIDKVNLDRADSLVIYTSAIPDSNPELKEIKKRKIDRYTYFEFLGELSCDYKTIAISGTHGKSTTTTLIALMMINAGLDPTVFVGSKILSLNSNFHLGKTNYLLVEACEYNANLLHLNPHMIGLVSVDRDHLDYYKNLTDIKNTFQKFINKLEDKSQLIYNADDINIQSLDISKSATSIGLSENSKLYVKNVKKIDQKQVFDIYIKDSKIEKKFCKTSTVLPGYYNIYNILISVGIAIKLGINSKIIKNTIESFQGLWRRFEFLGNWKTNMVFSDYAHHPTAIKALLYGARGFFKNKRIIIIFQPHQEDRTEKLFDEFLTSFELADEIILYPTYRVSGRRSKSKKNTYEMYKQIKKNYLKDDQCIYYSKDFGTLENELKKYKDAVILVVGAGDIDNFPRHFLKLDK